MSRTRSAGTLAVGSAVTGLLAYVFFVLLTRGLGAERAAGVSLLWTWWSLSAAALTFPLQHWVVRTIAAAHGHEGGVRHALPRVAVVVAAVSVLTTAVAWWLRQDLFGNDGPAFPVLVGVVTAGSAYIGVVRGVLTARGRLHALAAALVGENALRCLLAGGLLLLGSEDARLFGLALAAGHLVGLAWPAVLRLGADGGPRPWLRFVAGASGGQLLGQVVLTGGPVVLALAGGSPAEVTALFAALALFRLPYTLALGAVSPLTGVLTRLLARDPGGHALHRVLLTTVAATLVSAALAAGVAAVTGPWLLRQVFGSTVRLPGATCAVVAAGSVLALGCLLLSVLAMAADRPDAMLRGWLLGVGAAAGVLLAGPGTPVTTVAVAFLAAEAVAFGTLAVWRK